MNEPIRRLEEKIAYLERHVTEQDKAMLEMAEGIAALRRELATLRDRSVSENSRRAIDGDDEAARDERPPHY